MFTLNHPQPSLHSRKLRSLSVLHNTMCRVQYHIIQHNTTNWISDTFNTQGFSPHIPRVLHCIWFRKIQLHSLQFECLTKQKVIILISSNSTLDPLRLSLKLDVWMQFCQEFNSWITLQNIQMNPQFLQQNFYFQRFLIFLIITLWCLGFFYKALRWKDKNHKYVMKYKKVGMINI